MRTENEIKLLLVDDEAKFLKSVASRLELQNFEVTTATGGKEAIASAEKGLFDVAVVDLKMPGIDGLDFMKDIKQRHSDITIIMITGYATVAGAVQMPDGTPAEVRANPEVIDAYLGVAHD